MRQFLMPLVLLLILFLFPLQVFVIGDGVGIGIQGAVYRVQITQYGDSFILITQETMYVVRGIYTGNSALSVMLWALGTVLLTITTWYGLIEAEGMKLEKKRFICYGIAGSCIFFLMSCIARYGLLLQGPSGFSLPVGIVIILAWLLFVRFFPQAF